MEVTEGIADISWICPFCPVIEIENQQRIPATDAQVATPANNPHKIKSDTKSSREKSSKKSQQRKIELRLQKLGEQKKLEQKILDEKFRVLEELDSDCETNLDEEDL